MQFPIYFDYAATTPVDPRVAEKMSQYLTLEGKFGNSFSRFHRYGWEAAETVSIARRKISKLIGSKSSEIVFTSGATESVNLAIKGIAQAYCDQGKHIIVSKIEHKSVLDVCQYLKTQGFEISYLLPNKNGLISLDHIIENLRKETILLSIIHVNNEIGVIQDIQKIGMLCKTHNIIFHVDATQSVGKLHINLSTLPVDLMSFSSHKIYGPKGIGGLYIRKKFPKIRIVTQIHGGGHENGMRSGTLPVHQIVGMAEAYCLAQKEMMNEMLYLKKMKYRLWKGLKSIEGICLNGDLSHSISTILNVSFDCVNRDLLLLNLKNLALSFGSACTSNTESVSHVLQALGVRDQLLNNSIRLSIGRFTTTDDIDYAINQIQSIF